MMAPEPPKTPREPTSENEVMNGPKLQQPKAAPAPKPVTARELSDTWARFELSDGTMVRGKIVLVKAVRLPGQFSAEGDPQYRFNAQIIFDVISVRADDPVD